MSDIAIQAEALSKRYRIGTRDEHQDTLVGAMASVFRRPLRNLQRLRKMSQFGEGEQEADDIIWALKDVSFDVQQGEIVGVIGKNGAGKSTLLKILSRITEPTSGRAWIRGRVSSLLEVGTGFHPELTGRENVYLNGTILGMRRTEIDEKFSEIIEFSGIGKFIDTPVKRYSSGMYVRLAFAVAAHLEPEILIIDEVLAVGDASFQKKCLGRMGNIAREGRTVIFVSHNMPAVRSLCHRVLLIEHGQVQQDGDASTVIQRYLGREMTSEKSKQQWEGEKRPGNLEVRVSRVALKNHMGEEVPSVNMSEDVVVEIAYEIVEEGGSAGFSLTLYDMDGYCVFSSMNNHEEHYYGKPLPRGHYVTQCIIYGNLLNEGKFYISLRGFMANRRDPFDIEQAITFDVIDDGVLKGDYYGRSGGVVKPKLTWTTRNIS
jgi:lipopolysaccharide transport system ATP-binding protein